MKTIDLEFRIAHRNWMDCAARLFALLNSVQPGEVVSLVGPSRAGKTKMVDYMCKLLTDDGRLIDKGIMPVVVVEAANSGPNGSFSTKNFMIRLLEDLQHPMFSIGLGDDVGQESLVYNRIDKTTEASLRLVAERTLRNRQTRYLFIDEAQHVEYVTKGAMGPSAVMNSWKCMAKAANVVLVVVGAYPILGILQNSSHMVGRKHQVHLGRYGKNPDDIDAFASIVAAYGDHMGSTILDDNLQMLYEGSFGCIGLLRAWLLRSWTWANMADEKVTEKLLIETRLPETDLQVIRAEILQGEEVLGVDEVGSYSSVAPNTRNSARSSSKRRVPFQRKPKRIVTGDRKKER